MVLCLDLKKKHLLKKMDLSCRSASLVLIATHAVANLCLFLLNIVVVRQNLGRFPRLEHAGKRLPKLFAANCLLSIKAHDNVVDNSHMFLDLPINHIICGITT